MINGEIAFVISDSQALDISFHSGILPTKIVNKGDGIALGRKALQNRWLSIIKFNGQEEYLEKLEVMVNQLYDERDYITQLKAMYETVSIDIYIRSEFAEIGYSLPHTIFKKLALIDCTMNFAILSFGLAPEEHQTDPKRFL